MTRAVMIEFDLGCLQNGKIWFRAVSSWIRPVCRYEWLFTQNNASANSTKGKSSQ